MVWYAWLYQFASLYKVQGKVEGGGLPPLKHHNALFIHKCAHHPAFLLQPYLLVTAGTFFTGCSTKSFDRVVNQRVRKSAESTFPATIFPILWVKNELDLSYC